MINRERRRLDGRKAGFGEGDGGLRLGGGSWLYGILKNSPIMSLSRRFMRNVQKAGLAL